jgi:hypothetical protein
MEKPETINSIATRNPPHASIRVNEIQSLFETFLRPPDSRQSLAIPRRFAIANNGLSVASAIPEPISPTSKPLRSAT